MISGFFLASFLLPLFFNSSLNCSSVHFGSLFISSWLPFSLIKTNELNQLQIAPQRCYFISKASPFSVFSSSQKETLSKEKTIISLFSFEVANILNTKYLHFKLSLFEELCVSVPGQDWRWRNGEESAGKPVSNLRNWKNSEYSAPREVGLIHPLSSGNHMEFLWVFIPRKV